MAISKYLKKNICSFKPTSSNRAMLVELESLINLLNKQATVEDFINESLRFYLPTIIETFKGELTTKNNLKKIINEIEIKINNLIKNKNADVDFTNLKKFLKEHENIIEDKDVNNEEFEEQEDENVNPDDIMGRFSF